MISDLTFRLFKKIVTFAKISFFSSFPKNRRFFAKSAHFPSQNQAKS